MSACLVQRTADPHQCSETTHRAKVSRPGDRQYIRSGPGARPAYTLSCPAHRASREEDLGRTPCVSQTSWGESTCTTSRPRLQRQERLRCAFALPLLRLGLTILNRRGSEEVAAMVPVHAASWMRTSEKLPSTPLVNKLGRDEVRVSKVGDLRLYPMPVASLDARSGRGSERALRPRRRRFPSAPCARRLSPCSP
jgi:hypothetical protein